MEYILVSQLKLVLLKISNSDDETVTVLIVSFFLLLILSKSFIVYIFTKHCFVNYVLCIISLFIIFVFHRVFFKSAK